MTGGAEHVAINLSRGFIEKGFKVDVLLACQDGQLLPLLPPAVKVVRFKTSRTIFAIPLLVAYLRRSKPDAVISFLTHANIVAVVSKVLARYKGRLILTEHSSVTQNLVKQPGYKNKTMLLLMKRLYPLADKVVAVSSQLMHELETTIGINNVTRIYNPVDSSFPDVETIDKLRNAIQARPGFRYSIAAVGRLTRAKNFAMLIKSIKQVRDKVPVVLNIIGEGEERTNLEKLIRELDLSDHVFLRGYSAQPKAWMRLSDLLVLSSSWEGFSLVLAEALSMGTTVVSTNCQTGPAEILDHGKYGYLVPVNDIDKLTEGILYALEHPMDPDLLRERAAMFSVPKITDDYLQVVFPDIQPRS